MNTRPTWKSVAPLLIIGLALGAAACGGGMEPETGQQPIIGQPTQSECLAEVDGEDLISESVELLVTGDRLRIVDHNAEFNCCLDAWMEVSIDGARISVVEMEDPDDSMACDCICPYELAIEISNLAAGDYQVSVYRFVAQPDNLIHEQTVCVGDDCQPAPECQAAGDCLEKDWLVDCLGHWACEQGACAEVCDFEACGDGTCDAAFGESAQSCPEDCAAVPDPDLASFQAACGECGAQECYEPDPPHFASRLSVEIEPTDDGLFALRAVHQVLCIDVGLLGAELIVEGNTLVLIEDFDHENPVDCYCNQAADILITGLTPGAWALQIYDDDRDHLLIQQAFTVTP